MTPPSAPTPPLIGRDAELREIGRRIEALRGGQGGVASITGLAGSGKTRMLAEVSDVARAAGIRVLGAAAEPGAEMVPFAALRAVTGLDLAQLDYETESRYEVLRVVSERLERAALDGPLLFIFDDVQWADAATAFALDALPRRLSSHAILWMLAARPDPSTMPGDPEGLTVRLDPLDPRAVQRLTTEVLGGEPDQELLDLINQAGGSPFVLVELLRGLAEEGLVRRDGPRVQLAGRGLPVRLHDLVARQLRGLSPLAVEAARMASVVGRPCSPEDLARFLDVDDAALAAVAEELLESGLLVRRDSALAFRHELLREAIAAALEEPVAQGLRRKAAAVLLSRSATPTELAPLLMKVAEPGDRPAIEVLRRASETLAQTAPATAAELSRCALELTPERDPTRAAIAAETIGHLYRAGRGTEARALAGAVLREGSAVAPEAEAAIRLQLAQIALAYDHTETIRETRLGLSLVGIPDSLRLYLQLTETLGYLMDGNAEAAQAVMLEDLAAARAAGDVAAEVAALNSCSAVHYRANDYSRAIALAEQSRIRAADADDANRLWPEIWGAWLRASIGAADDALERIAEGLPRAQRDGRASDLSWWLACRSNALFAAGRLVEARAEADATLQIGDDIGREGGPSVAVQTILARIAIHTGDAAALRIAEEAVADMRMDRSLNVRRNGAFIAGLLMDLAGDAVGAARVLEETVAQLGTLSPTLEGSSRDPATLVTLLRVVLRAGEPAMAAAVVAELERRATLNPSPPIHRLWARHARALLDGNVEEVLAGVASAGLLPSPVGRAELLEDAAGLLDAEATELLEAAHRLFREARATRDARRVRITLGHSDDEWRAELTTLEQDALRLAARGATDSESAAELGVTPQTVAALLRHGFAHLGIASRSELAEFAP